MTKPARNLIVFLLWLLVVIAGYYLVHKPVSPQQIASIVLALLDLILAALVMAACGGLGRRLLPMPQSHPLVACSVQASLGVGLFSLVWLAFGLAGLLQCWLAASVLLVSLIILRKSILSWLRFLTLWKPIWDAAGTFGRFLLIEAAFLALNQLWIALAPPVKFDALTYHLALPEMYVSQGAILHIPANPFSGHPQLAEMLYTWLALFGRPTAAAVFGWLAGVIFLAGLAGFTFESLPGEPSGREKATAAAVALVAVLIGATARWMLGWAYSDLFSAWMGLALIVLLFRWQRSGAPADLLWAGVFVGLAVSVKLTNGVIAVVLFLGLWVIRGLRRPAWRSWLASGALALAVFLPWALKNLASTGNPLFPFFFPTTGYSAERIAAANPANPGYRLLPQLGLPLYLTWMGVEGGAIPSADIGPLLVLLAIPAIIALRKDAGVRFLALAPLTGWVAMAMGSKFTVYLAQTRLFFVLLPALAILAGWGWVEACRIQARGVRLGRVMAAATILMVGLAIVQDSVHLAQTRAIPTILGIQSQQDYLDQNTGAYIHAMDALADLPDTNRILMLWETRALYAPANATPDPWIDHVRTALREQNNADSALTQWREDGYTHVLLNVSGMEFLRENNDNLTPAEWQQFDYLLELLPKPVELAGPYYLLYPIPPG